jgi:hypothetical protein
MNTGRTYFIDLDGTILPCLSWEELEKHNKNTLFTQPLLVGVKEFFNSLNIDDTVVFTTARTSEYRELTERTLKFHDLRYKHLIMNLGVGRRYLINDTVNILYPKSIAINVLRNQGFGDTSVFNPKI